MATTDQTAGFAASDAQWVARVKAALAKAETAMQFEAVGTANHTARLALVGRILAAPDTYALKFATLVAVDSTVAAQSNLSAATDAQVENAVNGLLDMFALQGQ